MARSAPSAASREAFWEGAASAERFFMGLDEVHGALRRLAGALELTREGLAAFKAKHLGLGWVERFPGPKGMRDTETGVKIDVLITGDYPGDGKPKPIAFPDPSVAEIGGGVRILPLRHLIELKLASGMTNPDRLKDLADVQELIRHAGVARELGDELDPMVRARFFEIWDATRRDEIDD